MLLIALERDGRITKQASRQFDNLRLSRHAKEDPELPASLAARSRQRRKELLERGISTFYAELCFEAFTREIISAGRLAEMMLVDRTELDEVARLFGAGAF